MFNFDESKYIVSDKYKFFGKMDFEDEDKESNREDDDIRFKEN